MKLLLFCFGLALAVNGAAADELHLRDGSVIAGKYVGGTAKMVYFERTPAGTDMYPLFMVESVTFNQAPSLMPGPSAQRQPPRATQRAPGLADFLATHVKWAFALFFPPASPAYFAHPAD